jgi:mRNA interferase MazF
MVEEVLRGEVYWGRLDPVIGSEMAKTRPVLIVQNDLGNLRGRTTIVVPITSRGASKAYPFVAELRDGTLPKRGFVNCAHIRAVDKARLRPGLLATVDEATMARVDDALRASLGLR